jgi:predicted metalloprotease with PDZ domain
MPPSTVKHVSGPLAPQETELTWAVKASRFRQNVARKHSFLRARWTVYATGVLLSLGILANAQAQTLTARISITSTSPGRIKIEAQLPDATRTLSFRNTYAGVVGLGERIETIDGVKSDGTRVPVQKLAPGEFQSGEAFSRVTYEVNLAIPLRSADLSHVSSLNSEQGVLMLADLLPQYTRTPPVVISFDMPDGWTVASNVRNQGSQFFSDDSETAVFLLGSSIHEKRRRVGKTDYSVIMTGKWPFTEDDAAKIVAKILDEYSQVTGFQLKRNAAVMLVPYPGETGPSSWSAETRGNVVVLLLGRNAKRKSVLSRLGIVLSHELFHLWVPNSLKLEGAYDWFFEGFTLYQALRMDLRLGLISFDDYLETIASVYDAYLASPDRDRLSLIEASERRWTGSGSLVYEKGMLVAFLFDLALNRSVDCRVTFDDLYAELFRRAATGQGSANEIIIGLLSERAQSKSFVKDYVESTGNIDLDAALSTYGIQVQREGATKLAVSRNLSKSQRSLLGCIGFRK